MATLDGDTGRVLTLIARLDLALDILGALRADMRTVIPADLGDGKEWEEALKEAQMSVGEVVHTLESAAMQAGYLPWPHLGK